MDLNGLSDPYVRLHLGKYKFKTKVVKKCLNPCWDEEFNFKVDDLSEELSVSVLDEDKYFSDDFLGQVKVPVSQVLESDNMTLGAAWFTLQPKSKKSKSRECGDIRLTISLSQNNNFSGELRTMPQSYHDDREVQIEKTTDVHRDSVSLSSDVSTRTSTSLEGVGSTPAMEENLNSTSLLERLVQFFVGKNGEDSSISSRDLDLKNLSEIPVEPVISEQKSYEFSSHSTFDEAIKSMESRDDGGEMPGNLPGGVLLDQSYVVSPSDLNSLLFSDSSKFWRSLAEVQGTTELQEGPWQFENSGERLKRVVTYLKAASKLVKAVRATEEQMYLKANGKEYAVLVVVSTPDVPYGSYFRTELLFCIMLGPELPSEDLSSRLVISWRMNFLQSTMMKSMIENGARQGLKDNYADFAELLSKNVKMVDPKDLLSGKEQILASLQVEEVSDWKMAVRYFGNFTVVITILLVVYVSVHILLANPSTIQGLEFVGLDLPDSIGEIIVCGILVLQGKRVLDMIACFLQARVQRGSDHGVKAQGDGWLLTVALIEGTSLAAVDSTGFSDPYVVFSCNGRTKTSSIKFQILDPQWNEIFEFDAMDDPPSTMNVEVFDFDGPFDEAKSLGHAEVNFVKSNLSDLADVWIPLQGKLAQACQSKLHLRVFLNNTRGTEIVKDYLTKVEKEVGKKINVRSPQTNSTFQKLFGLPPEEFLINDFTCHLKRKMPMQGRLFLSPRIIGFYATFLGTKLNFSFSGKTLKTSKTIMALWKAKSLSPEQKVQIVEEESDAKILQTEDSGSFLEIEDSMTEVFSSFIPIQLQLRYQVEDFASRLKCNVQVFLGIAWLKSTTHQKRIRKNIVSNLSKRLKEMFSLIEKELASGK
ncbi:C2 and GRAM domain-containing protein [Acorus calamus]|uniref:C2 and GRAM domain-containing protein n=1 Tax=Acorus calamus TaxID=4465 RepID=A0AAV9ECV4_ACOCL|nr:C2 and GRAM domain-containing protein [Acorus calamus]